MTPRTVKIKFNMKTAVQKIQQSLRNLKGFISHIQARVVISNGFGEEGKFFADKIEELSQIVAKMPLTRQATDKMVYLHYFTSSADFYIMEKDMGAPEILAAGAELDFHFTPKMLVEVQLERRQLQAA